MEDTLGPLLFEEELSPEQEAALRERFEETPELADAWARWQRARRQIRRRLQDHLPDRRLLVLYALEQEGHDEVLTADEQMALDAARDDIAEAIDTIPALDRIVDRIQEERADFEAVWDQHRGGATAGTTASERQPAPERKERAPRRLGEARAETTVRRWTWRLTVAVLFLGAAILAVLYGPQGSSQTTVTVSADEQRTVELSDGSTVRLIGAAALSYADDGAADENRRVTLKRGQAYFDVVRDERSFVVNTPTATATVLGTEFGVRTQADTTEVVLVEGTVRVGAAQEAGGTPVTLEPGEQSIVPRGQAPSAPMPVDLTATLDWTGLFVFRSMPAEAIAQRLSRHYDASVAVAPALADEPVTGTFEREQPVSEVLGALARTLRAEVRTQNGTYRLEPAP